MSRQRRILPGFGLSLGYSLFWLGLIVLVPLAALFLKSFTNSPARFWQIITEPRVIAAFKLSFSASLVAALINAVFGFVVAWTLVRYAFPGKKLIDAMVDLPFALPTAVSGIALTSIYAPTGWVGQWLYPLGVKSAYSPLGVTIALTFIGLPFVVRTLQPALQDLDAELEEAAASLGATRWQTFRRVILPAIFPPLLTGFTLAFARALGEYGSVVFISANKPLETEIVPLMIIIKLEEYDYSAAAAIAVTMLVFSFALLVLINGLQWWSSRHQRRLA
ncbi:MAG: sulfate ABC transporter permease subunit CysT [Tepidisphaeraceae bacterium]